MDRSTQVYPVHRQIMQPAQTHVHEVGDATQPSHPLSSPSPPALNLSSISMFSSESALRIRWPKYWSFSFSISPSNEYSGLISFRIDVVLILLLKQNHIKCHVFLLRETPLRPIQTSVAYSLLLPRTVPWSGCAVTVDLTCHLLKDFGVIFSLGLL